ncbi:hypothetical protein L9F63_011981 [Diploptera punctata]|uniref:Uncharacterized protein n=1 Tax=Diploptera punctata TaxID=6984 RepID=A0AAD8EP73_DIPPU|nr:hypothetical protein L9F63_011981 [Diploptera punctata]
MLITFSNNYTVRLIKKNPDRCKDLSEICQKILNTILYSCIKEFDLDVCDAFTINVAMKCLRNVPNLTRLKITLEQDFAPLPLDDKISYLKNLRKLEFPIYCTNMTLEMLSIYCKGLNFLDIHESDQVDDNCVNSIILLQNLVFLNIQECRVSDSTYRVILQKLPRLRNISWYSEIDDVIKEYSTDYYKRIEIANVRISKPRILIERLYNLIELDITYYYDSSQSNINLSCLAELEQLKIFRVTALDPVQSGLNIFLEHSGHKLKIFEMNSITNVFFSVILVNCSNLESLYLRFCDIIDEIVVKREMEPHFLNLEKLQLFFVSYCGKFYSFVYFYRNLKVFQAGFINQIDDEFVNVTLRYQGFRNLEEFVVEHGKIKEAVQELIYSCPNLKLLGEFGYPDFPEINLMPIKNIIQRENMALKLLIRGEVWSS